MVRSKVDLAELEDTSDYVCSMSSEEFEVYCMDILKAYAKENNLEDFLIEHNVKKKSHDGTYQIDVYALFTALNVSIKVLCECKQYKNKVKRELVQILDKKLESLGMNKGILMSTSGFQKGAIQYAKEHGIALIQVFDHSCEQYSCSGGPDAVCNPAIDPFEYARIHWPKYKAVYFSDEGESPVAIYPTKEMIEPIFSEMNRIIKNWKSVKK